MKWPDEKHILYIPYKNPKLPFTFRPISLFFILINALVYVDINQGIQNKLKWQIMEKANLWVFVCINMPNFEAFYRVISSSISLLFQKSA